MARFPRLAIFGLPLRTTWTWIAVALALAAITLTQLAPAGGGNIGWLLWATLVAAGAIASLFAHDYGHVLAARRLGARLSSLEPSAVGALSDTSYSADRPSQEVQVALGGPAVSAALALGLGALWWLAGSPRTTPASALWILAAVNGGITALSLLPGYPFDGGRIFRAFLWFITDDIVRATRIAATYGHVLLFMALLGGVTLLSIGENNAVWGTWVLILSWTINRARSEGVSQILWTEAGKDLQIDDLFQAGVNRVAETATIDESIESLLDNFRRGPTLVVREGEVTGIVDLAAVRRVPRAGWTQTRISEVMTPLDNLTRLESSAPVSELLSLLPTGSSNVVLVENNGRVVAAADRNFAIDRVESYIRAQYLHRRRRR